MISYLFMSFSFFAVENKKSKILKHIIWVNFKVKSEIENLRSKVKLAKDTINKFKIEVSKVS